MPAHSEHLRYLRLLARRYPTVAAAASEIIRIEAVLRLPKGTEHFMSDLHGEHEAFVHILNSASGVIHEKIDFVLGEEVPAAERAELATLIYYPTQKLPELKARQTDVPIFWTSCSTPILRTTTRTFTTARSSTALCAMTGRMPTSPGCVRSSNGWRWTGCILWGTCLTAAPGQTGYWTA